MAEEGATPSGGRAAQAVRSSWLPMMILGAAQFVMVLDSSVMNVSITQIVSDLDTTIQGVQLAITAYTLVMAAFMLVGAKLGDILGRDNAFAIGLLVYGAGSLTTALSPNLGVLLFGWSLVEGLGAVMVIPAIAALIAANYEGKQRALAYALVGGIAAIAVAAGPLIGGYVTTTFSWRYVFAAETVVVLGILTVRKRMRPAPRAERKPRLDVVGGALSALGLALIVFGVLKSGDWGWVKPTSGVPEVNGQPFTPFGFSPVLFMIVGGLLVLALFAWWEEHRHEHGKDALLDLRLLRIQQLRGGLLMLGAQQLLLMGTFFILPVYLQVVLGYDAFETGVQLLPLSISMLVAALLGPKLADRMSPRRVVQLGVIAVCISALVLLGTVDVTFSEPSFRIALAAFGAGAGLLASQLGNVIMSSVGPSKTSEAGGLQGTAQNLGASLGTALIGAILLAGLTSGFLERIANEPSIPAQTQQALTDATASGIDIIPVSQAETILTDAGLPPDQVTVISDAYAQAQLDGLKNAFLAIALLAVLALGLTRAIPAHAVSPPQADDDADPGPVAAGSPAS